jgi:hypothetical protein
MSKSGMAWRGYFPVGDELTAGKVCVCGGAGGLSKMPILHMKWREEASFSLLPIMSRLQTMPLCVDGVKMIPCSGYTLVIGVSMYAFAQLLRFFTYRSLTRVYL